MTTKTYRQNKYNKDLQQANWKRIFEMENVHNMAQESEDTFISVLHMAPV